MLKKIAIALAVLIAGILAFAATKPDTFVVRRSITIKAGAGDVFVHLDNFKHWKGWSPWEKLDPKMQRSYSGPPRGVGAKYAWKGNDQVGRGSMEITEVVDAQQVTIALAFFEPFEAHNVAEFTLVPAGDSTEVSWSMRGPQPFVSKVMCVFVDMDQMIGKDFEAGLANLRDVVER